MTQQIVIDIAEAGYWEGENGLLQSLKKLAVGAPTREMVVLCLILATLQVADGVLTAIGMSYFGIDAEGNGLLRSLMGSMGYIPALVFAKSIAIAVITGLCLISNLVSWLPHAMKALIAIYLTAAIIPWSYILISHL